MATSKRDIIAQAQSGTGKTGAFVMGSLAQVEQSLKDVQVIVLSPTRELAMQSAKIFDAFSLHMGIECRVFVGGGRVSDDIRALERGCQVVCGTPGRILDLIESRRALYTDKVKCFILDEADEMLDFGFADQIYKIFGFVPQSSQCVLVSATLPPEALDISTKFMRDPIEILVKKEALTLAGIKQFYVDCEKEEWKYGVLADLYECLSISQSIIFVNSRAKADWLGELMNKDGHTVAVMHAELEQDKRKLVIEQFRTGSCRVLISTDVLARGFDVQQVSVVINFDQPRDVSNYLHRIGRAGRYGRKGTGINLLSGSRDVVRALLLALPLPSSLPSSSLSSACCRTRCVAWSSTTTRLLMRW